MLVISVAITPGRTSLTRIPSAARRSAYRVVSIDTPALDTQYSPRLVEDTTELQLDTLTIAPLRPSTGSWAIICLATSCVRNILPLVLMPTT